jgi:hypothetical protein
MYNSAMVKEFWKKFEIGRNSLPGLRRPQRYEAAEALPHRNELKDIHLNPQEIFNKVAEKLHIPEQNVLDIINLQDGTKLIFSKGLSMSEVELAMMLKGWKKKVFHGFLNEINAVGATAYPKVKAAYQELAQLHQKYYLAAQAGEERATSEILEEITEFLGGRDRHVLDAGISGDRFFELLPELLGAFAPEELETRYVVNTLVRREIFTLLAERYGREKVVIRGSLLRGDCRAFGNGFNANMPWIHSTESLEPASGSDFDFKFAEWDDYQLYENDYQQVMVDFNRELAAYGLRIDTDLDVMSSSVYGDGAPSSMLEDLDLLLYEWVRPLPTVELEFTEIDTSSLPNLYKSLFALSKDTFDIQQLKTTALRLAEEHHLIDHTDMYPIDEAGEAALIEKFKREFAVILREKHRYDEEGVEYLVELFSQPRLRGLRRDSDFLGFVHKEQIANAFLGPMDTDDLSIRAQAEAINEIFGTHLLKDYFAKNS